MRIILLIISFVICAPIFVNANSSITAQMGICNQIEMSLSFRLINEKKEIPKSWDELIDIEMAKKRPLDRNGFRVKTINSFALVPGAPLIQSQSEIPREYRNHRLFMISREENIGKVSMRGRYAILIGSDGTDSKSLRSFSYFIPEETAKLILKQFPDFDPAKQPFAFTEADFERSEKLKLSEDGSYIYDQSFPEKKIRDIKSPQAPENTPTASILLWPWLLSAFILIVGTVYYFKNRTAA
jgi:hypothetical protein